MNDITIEPTYDKPIWYKKYRIYYSVISIYRYAFTHDDFDIDDNRCGVGDTILECQDQIDEIEDNMTIAATPPELMYGNERALHEVVSGQEAELTRLRAQVERMSEALKPFAEAFIEGNEDYPDNEKATTKCGRSVDYSLTLGDFRRAAWAEYEESGE